MRCVSSLQFPVSSLHSPVSILQSPFSSLHSPVSILQSPFSSLHSPVSILQSPVSSLQSLVSILQSLVFGSCSPLCYMGLEEQAAARRSHCQHTAGVTVTSVHIHGDIHMHGKPRVVVLTSAG